MQYASVIHSSGTDLLRLLNDILDLAKVESGTVTLEISELALDELKDAPRARLRPRRRPEGRGASRSSSRPTCRRRIATDPGRLRQVLKNLLSNAFKFTEQGEVSVRIGRADSGWSPANDTLGRADAVIAFSIADTGIGITAETQRRIFEAFAQADGTTARQYGGTGLGLSISRELVRLLGGEIALTSTPGQGSTFTVYLPSALADGHAGDGCRSGIRRLRAVAAAATRRRRFGRPPAWPGMKALVVDDDFRNIFALTTLLERGDLDVVSAESGEEGIAILERTPDIDIVLVDIMMPVMDGYATIRAMRNAAVGPGAADPRRHGQRDARGAPALHRRGRLRIRLQAGRDRRSLHARPRPSGSRPPRPRDDRRPRCADGGPRGRRRSERGPAPRSWSSTTTRPSASRSARCSRRWATRSSRPTRDAPRCAPFCARPSR